MPVPLPALLFICLLGLAVACFENTRRRLERLRSGMQAAALRLDAAVRERHIELQALIDFLHRYLGVDARAVAALAEARAAVFAANRLLNTEALGQAEAELRGAMLWATQWAERDAAISADPDWKPLRDRLGLSEAQIIQARFRYNRRACRFAAHLRQFPDQMVARWCRLPAGRPIRLGRVPPALGGLYAN